jgi:phosphonatase-like hydrolase
VLTATPSEQNSHAQFFHDFSVWTGEAFPVNHDHGSGCYTELPMRSIKLVIFDIAGTIVEDHGEVLSAFAAALRQHQIPFTESELQEWKGAAKREVIRHFVERQPAQKAGQNQIVEAVYSDFRNLLEEHYKQNVVPISGTNTTFAWLRERGIQIATTSGFYGEVAGLILNKAGWRETFAANISSSDVDRGRPAPYMIFRAMEATGVSSVQEVMNVGDTPLDLQAGTNAGVRGVVGVLTGLHKQDRLQREPHTDLVPSVAHLPALIEKKYLGS